MDSPPDKLLELDEITVFLENLIGRELREFWIVVYVFQQQVNDLTNASPELVFEDAVLRLDIKIADRLLLQKTKWKDPFADLTWKNLQYVFEYGKWTKVEMSEEADYRDFVGKPLTKAVVLKNSFDDLAGIQLLFEDKTLTFLAITDEYRLFLHSATDELAQMEFSPVVVIS